MRTFEYRGFDASGSLRRGLIEAADAKEARERLAARGILAERVDPAGGSGARHGAGRAFGAGARVFLYREMGVLLSAGLPLVRALDILIESPELGRGAAVLAGARDRVREGGSLASALAAAGPGLRPFEQALLEAGERAGSLDAILERLASFLEEQQRLRERVVSALIYPVIILAFALCVAVVMLGFVIPSAARLLVADTAARLPLLTRAMMAAGGVLVWALPAGGAVAGVALIVARRRWQREAAFRRGMERLVHRLPVAGRGYRLLVNLRCARTLAILLKGGVSAVEALPLAGRASGSTWVAEGLAAEAERVRHGSTLADALRRVPLLSAGLPAWVQAGEASGSLETLLEMAGRTLQHQWERFVTRTLTVLEPVLIALIGGFVLLVTLSVLLPVISLNRLIG